MKPEVDIVNIRTILMNALTYRRSYSIELVLEKINGDCHDRMQFGEEIVHAINALLGNPELVVALAYMQKVNFELVVNPASRYGFDHSVPDSRKAINLSDETAEIINKTLKDIFVCMDEIEASGATDEVRYERSVGLFAAMIETSAAFVAAVVIVGVMHIAMKKALEAMAQSSASNVMPVILIGVDENEEDMTTLEKVKEKLSKMFGVKQSDIDDPSVTDDPTTKRTLH